MNNLYNLLKLLLKLVLIGGGSGRVLGLITHVPSQAHAYIIWT